MRKEGDVSNVKFTNMRFALNDDKSAATLYMHVTKISGLNEKSGKEKGSKVDWDVEKVSDDRTACYLTVGTGEKAAAGEKALVKILSDLDPGKEYSGGFQISNDDGIKLFLENPDGPSAGYIKDFLFQMDEVADPKIDPADVKFVAPKAMGRSYKPAETEQQKLEARLAFLNAQLKLADIEPVNHLGELNLLRKENGMANAICTEFKLLMGG